MNSLYARELAYNAAALSSEVQLLEAQLNPEQKAVYDAVLLSIDQGDGITFFLDAPGGTGKTFLMNLLLAKIRSRGHIALAVASSGIAATLLTGGRTAHSTFKLPLDLANADSPTCNIAKQSDTAEVLRACDLIVWDESTMAHKGAIEALDRTLQDLRDSTSPMGGTTVLLAGDFRQTLPVIPRGTRADEVPACLKSSPLWRSFAQLSLTTNMRVSLSGDPDMVTFASSLMDIGNGSTVDALGRIPIPPCLGHVVDDLDAFTSTIYPDIDQLSSRPSAWFCERAILAPRNSSVSTINHRLLEQFTSPERRYKSVDTMLDVDDAPHYPVEFLNTLSPSGLPQHICF